MYNLVLLQLWLCAYSRGNLIELARSYDFDLQPPTLPDYFLPKSILYYQRQCKYNELYLH